MKLIYTLTVEVKVENLESYQDGNTPVTTIQQAAAMEELWLKSGELDPIDLLCNADHYTVTVRGED